MGVLSGSHFPHPFPDQASKILTSFQAWPLRNKILHHHYLVKNAMRKNSKNAFRIPVIFFLSHSRTSVAPLKTKPDSTPKMVKVYTHFQTEMVLT